MNQVVFGGQPPSDLGIGKAAAIRGDDVFDVMTGVGELTVELERDVLVQQDPQEASLTAGGMWAAR